jgi:preprotein translocase SecF subunit
MWFRYNLILGITALIALVHDPVAALASIAVTFQTIDMNVIAAILTLIGYSINDTIVVYDRIRENMKLYQGKGLSLGDIMNLAINQTLSRTILTSVVTLLTVIVLFFFGGDVLRGFAFVLGVGIIVGTYSSIFIASALAYVIMEYRRKRQLAGQASGKPGSGPAPSPRRKPTPKPKAPKGTEAEA